MLPPVAYDPIEAVRGEPITLLVNLTKDGDPWTDAADWLPEAEVRSVADALKVAGTWDITFDGAAMTMVLKTIDMADGDYVTDVDFYDPDIEDRDLARITWPGAGAERLSIALTADVSRVIPAP